LREKNRRHVEYLSASGDASRAFRVPDDEEVRPVRIVDADDPDIIYEELTWMTRRDAEKLAEQLGHEFTEV